MTLLLGHCCRGVLAFCFAAWGSGPHFHSAPRVNDPSAVTVSALDEMERNSFTVMRNVLPTEYVSRAAELISSARVKIPDDPLDMRAFRVFNLFALDIIFASILEMLPQQATALLTEIMGPWHIGSFHALSVEPQIRQLDAQELLWLRSRRLHSDYPFGDHAAALHGSSKYKVRSTYPKTVQLILMLDDFTEESGGTLVWPGSHNSEVETPDWTNESDRVRFLQSMQVASGKAGDMLMYFGLTWHSYGVNVGSFPRRALLIQCLPFYMKPMENHARALPDSIVSLLSPAVRARLGIFPDFPFDFDMGVPL